MKISKDIAISATRSSRSNLVRYDKAWKTAVVHVRHALDDYRITAESAKKPGILHKALARLETTLGEKETGKLPCGELSQCVNIVISPTHIFCGLF